jgi:hypothetical protein
VCPNLKEMGKKSREPGFKEDLYQGIWYELAYHDVTQASPTTNPHGKTKSIDLNLEICLDSTS